MMHQLRPDCAPEPQPLTRGAVGSLVRLTASACAMVLTFAWQKPRMNGKLMMSTTYSNLSNRPAHSSFQRRALLLSTVVALGLVAVPTVAHASSRQELSSSYCSKVSAASVSAIVGHSVPAGSYSTYKAKATKTDHEISGVVSSCTYGAGTTLAALAKDVVLDVEVTSRSLTGADLKYALSQAAKLKIKFTPYSGLGMTAFYYTFTEEGINVQGMDAIAGTTSYSAGIYTKTPAISKLAALVKLTEKL